MLGWPYAATRRTSRYFRRRAEQVIMTSFVGVECEDEDDGEEGGEPVGEPRTERAAWRNEINQSQRSWSLSGIPFAILSLLDFV